MPVFLAHAIEDSTDIIGIWGVGDGLNPPNPPYVRHCHRGCYFHCLEVCCVIVLDYNITVLKVLTVLLVFQRSHVE